MTLQGTGSGDGAVSRIAPRGKVQYDTPPMAGRGTLPWGVAVSPIRALCPCSDFYFCSAYCASVSAIRVRSGLRSGGAAVSGPYWPGLAAMLRCTIVSGLARMGVIAHARGRT